MNASHWDKLRLKRLLSKYSRPVSIEKIAFHSGEKC